MMACRSQARNQQFLPAETRSQRRALRSLSQPTSPFSRCIFPNSTCQALLLPKLCPRPVLLVSFSRSPTRRVVVTTLHCSQEPGIAARRSHPQAGVDHYGRCTLHGINHRDLHILVNCLAARITSAADVCSLTERSGMTAPHQKVL